MVFDPWRPGLRGTAQRLNDTAIIGAGVFAALRTTNQSVPSGTENVANAIQWDSVTVDILSGWSAGTPTRWTATKAGLYQVSGGIGYNSQAGGTTRDALWFRNGSGLTGGRARQAWPSGAVPTVPLMVQAQTMFITLAVGDYVELVPGQNSTFAINTAVGTIASYINITYAGTGS